MMTGSGKRNDAFEYDDKNGGRIAQIPLRPGGNIDQKDRQLSGKDITVRPRRLPFAGKITAPPAHPALFPGLYSFLAMADEKPPLSHDFVNAADRQAHDQLQIFYSLPVKVQREILDRIDQADKARATKEREQKTRSRTDMEDAKRRQLLRHRTPEYVPPWAQRRLTAAALNIRAKNDVKARNQTELHAIEQKLEEDISRILAANGALEKKKELDKSRDALKTLAAQKRKDREVTRPTKWPDRYPGTDREKDAGRTNQSARSTQSKSSGKDNRIARAMARVEQKGREKAERQRASKDKGRGRE